MSDDYGIRSYMRTMSAAFRFAHRDELGPGESEPIPSDPVDEGYHEPMCRHGHRLEIALIGHACAPRYSCDCAVCRDYDTPIGYGETKGEALSDYEENAANKYD